MPNILGTQEMTFHRGDIEDRSTSKGAQGGIMLGDKYHTSFFSEHEHDIWFCFSRLSI